MESEPLNCIALKIQHKTIFVLNCVIKKCTTKMQPLLWNSRGSRLSHNTRPLEHKAQNVSSCTFLPTCCVWWKLWILAAYIYQRLPLFVCAALPAAHTNIPLRGIEKGTWEVRRFQKNHSQVIMESIFPPLFFRVRCLRRYLQHKNIQAFLMLPAGFQFSQPSRNSNLAMVLEQNSHSLPTSARGEYGSLSCALSKAKRSRHADNKY